MNVYIIKKATGEVLSVNRTLTGVAMEAYGLDIVTIEGDEASKDALESKMTSKPVVECLTSDDEIIYIERHYLSN